MQKPSTVDTPPGRTPAPETTPENTDVSRVESQDLSVFNFISSQDSGSSCPQTRDNVRKTKKRPPKRAARRKPQPATSRPTRRRSKEKLTEQRLQSINQLWGITTEEEVSQGEEHAGRPHENPQRSSKRVSFFSPAVSQNPGRAVPHGNADLLCASVDGVPQGTVSAGLTPVLTPGPAQPACNTLSEPMEAPKQDSVPSPQRTPKRPRAGLCAPPEGTPKRPRAGLCAPPGAPRRDPAPRLALAARGGRGFVAIQPS